MAHWLTLSCLAVPLALAANEIKGLDDSILFRLNWAGTGTNLLESPDYEKLLMTTTNNEQFECLVPIHYGIEKDGLDSYQGQSALSLLMPLFKKQNCNLRLESYWTYELCHGMHIKQYHEEREGKSARLHEYSLGETSMEVIDKQLSSLEESLKINPKPDIPTTKIEGINMPYFVVNYTDGTQCDLTGRQRSSHVLFVCYEDGRHDIYSIKEIYTCEYEIVVLSPLLCEHPAYRPRDLPQTDLHCVPIEVPVVHVQDDVYIARIIGSSEPHHSGGKPHNAIDGNSNTIWNPSPNYNNWYITFELMQSYTVLGVKLHNFGDDTHDITSFKLEASNDQVTWQMGGSVSDVTTGSRDWQSFDGFTATGKYLKFTVTQTYLGWQPWLPEITFTGYPSNPVRPRNLLQAEAESLKLRSHGTVLGGDTSTGSVKLKVVQDGQAKQVVDSEDGEVTLDTTTEGATSPKVKLNLFPPQPSIDQKLVEDFLNGDYCLHGGSGWWKYEFCYGRKVEQYHEGKDGSKTVILLGEFNVKDHLEWITKHPEKRYKSGKRHVAHFYTGGSICDLTGQPRTVEVKLKCKETSSPSSVALYLLEPVTCQYTLGVETSIVCPLLESADENGLFSKSMSVKEDIMMIAGATENVAAAITNIGDTEGATENVAAAITNIEGDTGKQMVVDENIKKEGDSEQEKVLPVNEDAENKENEVEIP